ncbi:MAG: EAL domain-containing protein, partial [Gammaproteobacteria bacterium]
MQDRHLNIASALSEDSFVILEQLAELFTTPAGNRENNAALRRQLGSTLDNNWEQWQFIWDLENISFFDHQGRQVNSWGRRFDTPAASVSQVLLQESPVHSVICPDVCYQQVITPVMGKSALLGVLSLSRSFAEIVIKYKRATDSDIGILVEASSAADQRWPYRLSAKTFSDIGFDLLGFVTRRYSIEQLLAHNEILDFNGHYYEIRVGRVQKSATLNPPFFIFVEDITASIDSLNNDLKFVWLQGVLSFLLSLVFLLIALWYFLRRILTLSKALPLLASHEYNAFRKRIGGRDVSFLLGYDEFDHLNQTVLNLTRQLEHLEYVVRENTLQILEKSQELAGERDFVQQLLDVAPIIIITQNLNGLILGINQAGADTLEEDTDSVPGKLFDLYLPPSEKQHIEKLNRLRAGKDLQRLQIDGGLINRTGRYLDVFWVHSIVPTSHERNEAIVLTLGVDISADKIAEQKMLKMALFDPLTGLGNKRRFLSELAHSLAMAKRYGHSVSLLSLEIGTENGKSQLIDKHFLLQSADNLRKVMRSTDLLCRMGENRFALIVPNAQQEGCVVFAKKIIAKINEQIFDTEERPVRVGINIGIAIYPMHGATVSKLSTNAEQALRYAKESGTTHYHVFDPGMDNRVRWNQRVHWQTLIEHALNEDKFELCFRPVFNVKAGGVGYYQCIARIRSNDGNELMPFEYNEYAEQLDLSEHIDRMLVRKAVQTLADFKTEGRNIHLSVLLSGSSLSNNQLCNELSQWLRAARVEPSQLIFEICESAVLSNFSEARQFINQVNELGCHFVLYEFGFEFSSFFYLKHLPVDYVKIDGTFIN